MPSSTDPTPRAEGLREAAERWHAAINADPLLPDCGGTHIMGYGSCQRLALIAAALAASDTAPESRPSSLFAASEALKQSARSRDLPSDRWRARKSSDTGYVRGMTFGTGGNLAASATAPGLDVRRVVQAITNIAMRHGLSKDPPVVAPTLMSIYGYSRATTDMDAEIAAEYARLAIPDPTGTPTD